MSSRSHRLFPKARLSAVGIAAFAIGCTSTPELKNSGATGPASPGFTADQMIALEATQVPSGAIVAAGQQLPALRAGQGYLALRVHWPRRIQTIPQTADLLIISIYDPLGALAAPQTRITRPTGDNVISNLAIPLKAQRHLTIWARAYRKVAVVETDPKEVAVSVGSASNVSVFDNVITPVSLELRYIPISVTALTPNNGGEGAIVTLTGVGFNGFVDPLNATISFNVRFTHQTVLEGNVPDFSTGLASPSAGTDLWIVSPAATRESDIKVVATVPDGAVSGPVDYLVDGISAALPRKTFRVLKQLAVWKNEGPGTGPDHAAVGEVVVGPGATQLFKARATDSLGVAHLAPDVKWTSDKLAVGVIEGTSGVFYARMPGRTKITAATGKLSSSVDVVVVNPGGTASIQVPLPSQGTNTNVVVGIPAFDQGVVTGIASP